MFYKESDAATKLMFETVATVSSRLDGTSYVPSKINDPVGRIVVEKYEVTRAPIPVVIGVHPNGGQRSLCDLG